MSARHPDLDRQFSPSSCVPSIDRYLREYEVRSADARRQLQVRCGLRYGEHPDETLDFFPAAGPGAPLHVFVHGGNWQALSKDDSAFAAPDFVAEGVAFVAMNYALAPGATLDAMVAMTRRCVRWLLAHAEALGVDRSRVQLSGHSAGAHLIAMAMTPDGSGEADLARAISGLVLLSGLYDLEPVRHSYVNDALRLDGPAALRNSPWRALPTHVPPVVIARGGNETEEYKRQHGLMIRALRRRTSVVDVVEQEKNHFDLPYDLGARGTPLGDAVLAQLGVEAAPCVLARLAR